ncbi:hypothetical protein PRK78_000249 [Emydomyces testavorans]|uniref:Uncharacterized protein n=1 Tax=Emydomyces testavorans TaxID=2070801 RepID=A0AAF0IHH5_9EURO|nr:hypothetical protein PRK78_000249 [Emydomyces testavorans]
MRKSITRATLTQKKRRDVYMGARSQLLRDLLGLRRIGSPATGPIRRPILGRDPAPIVAVKSFGLISTGDESRRRELLPLPGAFELVLGRREIGSPSDTGGEVLRPGRTQAHLGFEELLGIFVTEIGEKGVKGTKGPFPPDDEPSLEESSLPPSSEG